MKITTIENTTAEERLEFADANFVAHATWALERSPGMQVLNTPNYVLADSGIPCDTFNIICRARLTHENALSEARAAVEHFQVRCRPFSWWVGPADHPAALSSFLIRAGLVEADSEQAMAADLRSLPAIPLPPDFQIQAVRTPADLLLFAQTLAAPASSDDWVVQFYNRVAGVILSDSSPQRFFLGFAQGVPVATAELTLAGSVAGLYNISTLQSHRQRGFGTAITAHALHQARQLGYQIGVLQASADGTRIYRRLGFTTVGQITEYKPTA